MLLATASCICCSALSFNLATYEKPMTTRDVYCHSRRSSQISVRPFPSLSRNSVWANAAAPAAALSASTARPRSAIPAASPRSAGSRTPRSASRAPASAESPRSAAAPTPESHPASPPRSRCSAAAPVAATPDPPPPPPGSAAKRFTCRCVTPRRSAASRCPIRFSTTATLTPTRSNSWVLIAITSRTMSPPPLLAHQGDITALALHLVA